MPSGPFMTVSVSAFAASWGAVTSGLFLSRSQEYSSSRRSPCTTSVFGTRFAMGGAGRIGPRLYLRPRRRRPRPGTVRKCRLIMELKLTRCTLRPWRVGDEASLVRNANNRRVWRNLSRLPHPYTTADAHAWIARASAQSPVTDFAITVDGEAVGGIGVELGREVFHRSAEIGYWLGEAHWGRGIATEAVRALTEYAFGTFDLCRLQAGRFGGDPGAPRVRAKARLPL